MAEAVIGRGRDRDVDGDAVAVAARDALPVGSKGRLAAGWWGVWTTVATEFALFSYLLFSYFYVGAQSTGQWPPDGPPKLALAGGNTVILLLSSAAVIWGERGIRRGSRGRLLAGYGIGFVLGCVFVGVQLLEWRSKSFNITSHAYGSLFFTITGFHMAHVVVGLIVLLAIFVWGLLGLFGRHRNEPVSIASIYWHFVDVVWLVVFTSLYLTPRFI